MWKGTRALATLAAFMVTALSAGACSASDDNEFPSAIAESEVGSTTPAAEGSDAGEADAGATTDSQPPAEGGTNGGDPALAAGRDEKSRAARTIDDLNNTEEPAGTPDAQPAVFGAPNDGTIEQTFGSDRWTFDADAGWLLAIDVLTIDHDCRQDLRLNLVSPSGNRGEVTWVGNGGCKVHGPLFLEEAGEYSIEFVGGDGGVIEATTGAYQFVPLFLTELDIAPLVFDQPNEGAISEVFGVDRWTFNAAAGDVVTLDVRSIGSDCRQDLSFVLEDPTGQRISDSDTWVGNGGCKAHGPYQLDADGEYVIEFYGGDGGVIAAATGPYQFTASWLG